MEFIADTIQNLTHLELTNTLSESISIIIEERELLINPDIIWTKTKQNALIYLININI
mgnify:CR=1 FL=1